MDEAPEEIPDLSAPVATLYGVAYSQASAVLHGEYADDLDTARRAEAEAIDAAEQAQTTADEAQQRQRAAEAEAAALRERLQGIEERLVTAEQRATEAERKAGDSERRAVDAAATARTLRDVLDTLHPTVESGTVSKE